MRAFYSDGRVDELRVSKLNFAVAPDKASPSELSARSFLWVRGHDDARNALGVFINREGTAFVRVVPQDHRRNPTRRVALESIEHSGGLDTITLKVQAEREEAPLEPEIPVAIEFVGPVFWLCAGYADCMHLKERFDADAVGALLAP